MRIELSELGYSAGPAMVPCTAGACRHCATAMAGWVFRRELYVTGTGRGSIASSLVAADRPSHGISAKHRAVWNAVMSTSALPEGTAGSPFGHACGECIPSWGVQRGSAVSPLATADSSCLRVSVMSSLGMFPTYSLCFDCEGATRSCNAPAWLSVCSGCHSAAFCSRTACKGRAAGHQ